ncbi:MAG: hypothetical protein HKN47_02330, partial [Pirellulaceae bacterium]|nr:hypothetical protein [Pirellulaceae bacterium]
TVDEGALSGGNEGGSATATLGLGAAELFTLTELPGADGDGGVTYGLELSSAGPLGTSLVDTATGDGVEVIASGGEIIGQTDGAVSGTNFEVFRLKIDATTGDVELELKRAVEHADADADDSPSFDSDIIEGLGMATGDGILVRATLSDGEATPDTASATLDISEAINITDDGPDIELTLGGALLETDDGALTNGNEGGTTFDTEGVGTLFTVTTNDPGADGDGGIVYSLSLSSTNVTTTLVDVASDEAVVLSVNGSGVIEGRTATSDDLVFTLAVAAATGAVTLTQIRAVTQGDADANDSPSYDSDIVGLGLTTEAIYLNATLSDAEVNADTDTSQIAIDDNIQFTDDGPGVLVEDSTTGTYSDASGNWTDTDGGTASWADVSGADGYASLSIELESYTIADSTPVDVSPDLVLTEGATREYSFSITDDFNGSGLDVTLDFDLVFNDDGTYDISTDTPPATVSEFDTSQGTLDAGGPDPVRTLTIGTDEITFSAVEPTTAAGLIAADLNEGEAHIEANAAYLSDQQLNVSTSGIANGNNVLQGNTVDNGISGPDGLTTKGGKVDESFVVDPMENVSSVTVTIDNSVGGYNLQTEQLYYRVYDSVDGVSDWMSVDSVEASPLGGGQVEFTVGDANGPNTIDAVQLAMGTGTIKIPVISFTRSETFDPDAITLDFEATLTDDDGDTFSDDFSVTLNPDVIV